MTGHRRPPAAMAGRGAMPAPDEGEAHQWPATKVLWALPRDAGTARRHPF